MKNVRFVITHDCPTCNGTGKKNDNFTVCCMDCAGLGRLEKHIDLYTAKRFLGIMIADEKGNE